MDPFSGPIGLEIAGAHAERRAAAHGRALHAAWERIAVGSVVQTTEDQKPTAGDGPNPHHGGAEHGPKKSPQLVPWFLWLGVASVLKVLRMTTIGTVPSLVRF